MIYNGLDVGTFDVVLETDQQAVRRKYDLPSEFILAVGHLERRKNYLRLVEAMAQSSRPRSLLQSDYSRKRAWWQRPW